MMIKRNWFIYLALIIYLASAQLILNFGISRLKETSQYPYLIQVVLIASFFAVFIILNMVFYLLTRPILLEFFRRFKWFTISLEVLFVIVVLAAGVILRIYYIRSYPVGMESDYKFYYDVAIMIKNNTLKTIDNEFLILFPNTYGYAYILSIAMRILGTSKEVCLYLNVAFSMLTALFCYGIGRKIAGSVAGLCALLFVSFWPSQIIYSNINGTEATFNFFLYGAAFLAVILMKWEKSSKTGIFYLILLHFLCGVVIALSSAIRPMGLILMIACVIIFLSINEKLKFKNIHELSLRTIFLSKGFFRAFIILIGYFVTTLSVTAGISRSIESNVSGSGAMGYSLMVGMNINSDGCYNEDATNFLYDEYDRTKSAKAANDECMKVALQKIKSNPLGIIGLMAKKFFLVWSIDDYATTTNIATMNNQGLLTKNKEALFTTLTDINNIYYLFMVFFSAIGILFLMRKDNVASLFAVFFVGSVFLLILVEMQNRYHYYSLQSIALLAAGGIGFTFDWHKQRTLERTLLKFTPRVEELTAAALSIIDKDTQGEMSPDMPVEENKLQSIDVLKAIEDGHIKITATKSYADELDQKTEVAESTDQQANNSGYNDCPQDIWEEYNQDIMEKQAQVDNDYFSREEDKLSPHDNKEAQILTNPAGYSHEQVKELLEDLKAELLRKKELLDKQDTYLDNELPLSLEHSLDVILTGIPRSRTGNQVHQKDLGNQNKKVQSTVASKVKTPINSTKAGNKKRKPADRKRSIFSIVDELRTYDKKRKKSKKRTGEGV